MRFVSVVTLAVLLLAATHVDAAIVDVQGEKFYSDTHSEYRYEGELFLEGMTADAVSAKTPDSSTFEPLTAEGPGEWFLESPTDLTLAELQTGMGGSWTLRVVIGVDTYDYTFDVTAVQDSDFLPVPEVTDPADGTDIGEDHEFMWENNDAHLQADGYMAMVEDDTWEVSNGWMADGSEGSLPQDGESWLVQDMPTGPAEFEICYGVYLNLISNTSEPSGAPDITEWNSVAISCDEVSMNIIPEPVTLSLLALGGAALLRRRS
jgi:hypothetical protein